MAKRSLKYRKFKFKMKQKIKNIKGHSTKLILDILNTIITVIVGIIFLGGWGILVAFIPDIMLIFIISDLWQKQPKDKLTGWKLDVHLSLHSIGFIVALFLILGISIFISFVIFDIMWRIVVILVTHVVIDQVSHSKKYGGHFSGYGKSDYKKESE